MTIIESIFESRADDLRRKIAALDAMIFDGSTTEGEKTNARRLKKRLEDELSTTQDDVDSLFDDPIARMAMAQAAYDAKQERYKTDPTAELRDNIELIKKLQAKRKSLRPLSAMGDVEARRDIRDIDHRLEGLMKKWMPKEYEALLKKREKSRDAKYKASDKKRAAKAAKEQPAKSAAKKAYSENKAAVKKFVGLLKKESPHAAYINADGSYVMSAIVSKSTPGMKNPGAQAIRNAFDGLDEEEKKSFVAAAKAKRDEPRNGITEKQFEWLMKVLKVEVDQWR